MTTVDTDRLGEQPADRSLDHLSDELLLIVFLNLDIPELLTISRTSHRMRRLALDPLLHVQRRHLASARLSVSLQSRPSLSSLLPPTSTIYLSRTHVLARNLSRRLISIRLARNLSRRPTAANLVQHNILPKECYRYDRDTGEVVWGGNVAPSIVDIKRRVEREKVKDGLRGWLVQHAIREQHARSQEFAEGREREKLSVRFLVRRFTTVGSKDSVRTVRWGSPPQSRSGVGNVTGEKVSAREEPTRAKVLGLRKFWEGLAGGRLGVVGA